MMVLPEFLLLLNVLRSLKRKKLKNLSDCVPHTKTNLTGKRTSTISKTKESKYSKDSSRPQAKAIHIMFLLEAAPIIFVNPSKNEDKISKPFKPSNLYAP